MKPQMNAQMMNSTGTGHGHQYRLRNLYTGEVWTNEKLPPLLKLLRMATDYTFKVPHGNKVRTLILEQGYCIIEYASIQYEVTIERW